jgi:hypothetical protein
MLIAPANAQTPTVEKMSRRTGGEYSINPVRVMVAEQFDGRECHARRRQRFEGV